MTASPLLKTVLWLACGVLAALPVPARPAMGAPRQAAAAAPDGWATLAGTPIRLPVPRGWHVRKDDKPDQPALFISLEPIRGPQGEFLTGFSLNVFQRLQARTGGRPSAMAARFIASQRQRHPQARVGERRPLRPGVHVQEIEIVSADRPPAVRIAYAVIDDDAGDTLTLAWFESPVDRWPRHGAHGEALFAALFASSRPVSP